MSFLLDPPALLLIGLLCGKAYYLLTVFGDRVLRRGAMKRSLVLVGAVVVLVFWAYSALLYLDVIYFPWPLPHWYGGTAWMLDSGLPLGITRNATTDVLAVVIFTTYPFWFYAGTELGLAGHRVTTAQRSKERQRIIRDLSAVMFPHGGAIPAGAEDVGAAPSVEALLLKIPPLFQDALTLLLFVIDSRFFVFAFTGKWKRFVDLDSSWEKSRYIEVWESNAFLLAAAQILRITIAYAYYTSEQVYSLVGYNGPMVPNSPSWFTPGGDGAPRSMGTQAAPLPVPVAPVLDRASSGGTALTGGAEGTG